MACLTASRLTKQRCFHNLLAVVTERFLCARRRRMQVSVMKGLQAGCNSSMPPDPTSCPFAHLLYMRILCYLTMAGVAMFAERKTELCVTPLHWCKLLHTHDSCYDYVTLPLFATFATWISDMQHIHARTDVILYNLHISHQDHQASDTAIELKWSCQRTSYEMKPHTFGP